jgi:hypothetical protein
MKSQLINEITYRRGTVGNDTIYYYDTLSRGDFFYKKYTLRNDQNGGVDGPWHGQLYIVDLYIGCHSSGHVKESDHAQSMRILCR